MSESHQLLLRVQLSDRQVVIDQYRPSKGDEDSVCDQYLHQSLGQVVENLEGYFGTTVTYRENIVTALFAKGAHSDVVAAVRRHIAGLKIPGISIHEESQTAEPQSHP